MEAYLLEKYNAKPCVVPVDMNDAAVTGTRFNMKEQDRVAFIFTMGASTSAVVTFALKQHDAASSGTTKALSVDNPYFVKAGAATVWTRTDPASATDTYDLSTTFAAAAGSVVFEVLSEQLDILNGFAWVSITALDSTAAKLCAGFGICGGVRSRPGYNVAL